MVRGAPTVPWTHGFDTTDTGSPSDRRVRRKKCNKTARRRCELGFPWCGIPIVFQDVNVPDWCLLFRSYEKVSDWMTIRPQDTYHFVRLPASSVRPAFPPCLAHLDIFPKTMVTKTGASNAPVGPGPEPGARRALHDGWFSSIFTGSATTGPVFSGSLLAQNGVLGWSSLRHHFRVQVRDRTKPKDEKKDQSSTYGDTVIRSQKGIETVEPC